MACQERYELSHRRLQGIQVLTPRLFVPNVESMMRGPLWLYFRACANWKGVMTAKMNGRSSMTLPSASFMMRPSAPRLSFCSW